MLQLSYSSYPCEMEEISRGRPQSLIRFKYQDTRFKTRNLPVLKFLRFLLLFLTLPNEQCRFFFKKVFHLFVCHGEVHDFTSD